MYKAVFKRVIDIVIASLALVLLFPVIVFLVFLLFFVNSGKPFFIQSRPGRNGKIFKIIKLKTMNDRRDADGKLLPDAARLTALGKFIRNTSLDEVPQLLNVIKGDMSLIGPRPLLVDYLPLYNEVQKRRHEVRPGITGWAQVNGRNAINWQEKFNLDVWYVDNLSFKLDLKIIGRSFIKIFKSEGISENTQATVSKFRGNG